jgi:hypothetical protein
MPPKSGSSRTGSTARKDSSTQFEDLSINLESACGCCCASDCERRCGCHQVGRFASEQAVATAPRTIAQLVANLAHTASYGYDELAVGGNSYEVQGSADLTQANLIQHNSMSPPALTWFEKLRQFDTQPSSADVEESGLAMDDVTPLEEDFIPGLEIDEALEDSVQVGHDIASDRKSSINNWDHSFNRSSPSVSVFLREIGTNLNHHHFTRGPLPLLELRAHNHCLCDDHTRK